MATFLATGRMSARLSSGSSCIFAAWYFGMIKLWPGAQGPISVAVNARRHTHEGQRPLRLDQLQRWDLSIDDLAKDTVSVVRHDFSLLKQSGCGSKNLVDSGESQVGRTSPRCPCIGSITCKFLDGRCATHHRFMAPAVYWTPTMRTRPSAPVDAKQSLEEMAPIPTPPSVRDVTPSLCLSLVEFKGRSMMPDAQTCSDSSALSTTV